MSDQHNPIDLSGVQIEDPWALKSPEPTDLLAVWPDDQPPTFEEIRSLFEQTTGQPVAELDRLENKSEDVVWNHVIEIEPFGQPIIVWVESAESIHAGERVEVGAANAKWLVGLETMLDYEEPLSSYAWLMRLLSSSLDLSPAILDVNTTRWFVRDELNDLFDHLAEVEPPAEVLWNIHMIASEGGGNESLCWLHTHGLWRCGRPELEMIDVPRNRSGVAANLLNEVAEWALDNALPAPFESLPLGVSIAVTLVPWQEAVAHLDAKQVGSYYDRTGGDPGYAAAHTGTRAAVCGAPPVGHKNAPWRWPIDAISALADDRATIWRSRRATDRDARRARVTWPDLAMAFASVRSAGLLSKEHGYTFLAKVCFDANGLPAADGLQGATGTVRDDHREHMWLSIQSVDGDDGHGELLNDPAHHRTLRKGDAVTFDRNALSDWTVYSPIGPIGPSNRRLLREMTARLISPG